MGATQTETPANRLICAGFTSTEHGLDAFKERASDLLAADMVADGRQTYINYLPQAPIPDRYLESLLIPSTRGALKRHALKQMTIGLVNINPTTKVREARILEQLQNDTA